MIEMFEKGEAETVLKKLGQRLKLNQEKHFNDSFETKKMFICIISTC